MTTLVKITVHFQNQSTREFNMTPENAVMLMQGVYDDKCTSVHIPHDKGRFVCRMAQIVYVESPHDLSDGSSA